MVSPKRCSLLSFLFALAALASPAMAAILYESGTLGSTGITDGEMVSGNVPSANVFKFGFTGVRFELTEHVATSQVGGHFIGDGGGAFFGAIVALTGPADFPDSVDLSTSDVVGAAQLAFPNPSAEVFGDLSVQLGPGWYALVFGSGLFGAVGDGSAVRNNPDVGSPSYIRYDPNLQWFDLSIFPPPTSIVDFRFVVKGERIPEPNSLVIAAITVPAICFRIVFSKRG